MSKSAYRVGGTRGGQDQFKWDDVKTDNYRENYLGHSLQAPVGRWQRDEGYPAVRNKRITQGEFGMVQVDLLDDRGSRQWRCVTYQLTPTVGPAVIRLQPYPGKDLQWWNKKDRVSAVDMAQAQAEEEKARLRQQDDDLLNQALGLAPRTAAVQGNNLDKADLQQLLGKSSEAGAEQEESTERISGLGAAPAKLHDHLPKLSLKERELARLAREKERKDGGLTESSFVEIIDPSKEPPPGHRGVTGDAPPPKKRKGAERDSNVSSKEERKRLKREEKKRLKKEKKERKREKKRLSKELKNKDREREKETGHEGAVGEAGERAKGGWRGRAGGNGVREGDRHRSATRHHTGGNPLRAFGSRDNGDRQGVRDRGGGGREGGGEGRPPRSPSSSCSSNSQSGSSQSGGAVGGHAHARYPRGTKDQAGGRGGGTHHPAGLGLGSSKRSRSRSHSRSSTPHPRRSDSSGNRWGGEEGRGGERDRGRGRGSNRDRDREKGRGLKCGDRGKGKGEAQDHESREGTGRDRSRVRDWGGRKESKERKGSGHSGGRGKERDYRGREERHGMGWSTRDVEVHRER